MFTPGFDPTMQYKQRHKELMDEAQRYRLVREAREAQGPRVSPVTHMIALVGKGLVALGTRLEERESRFEAQPCGEAA